METDPQSCNKKIFLKDTYDLTGIHVLIADDVEFNVLVAGQMLVNCKATYESVNNGVEAVEKARKNKYNLILMDLQMPVMDGFEATEQIRTFNAAIPVIALTASAEASLVTRIKNSGMDDYLTKPFKPKDFYTIVLKYAAIT
ncbi:hypothetical protein BH11BAC6_BH11BAC6_17570 [soil metagenome]